MMIIVVIVTLGQIPLVNSAKCYQKTTRRYLFSWKWG